MKNMQQAADDVGVIAETVETLSKLMDKFCANHGNDIAERFYKAFPGHEEIDGKTAKKLYDFERELTPPDSYDEARDAWRRMGGHT